MPLKTELLCSCRRPMSLRQRLIVMLSVPMVVIVLTSSLIDFNVAQKTAEQTHDQALADTLFDLQTHIRNASDIERLDLSSEAEAMLRSNEPDKLYFAIRDGSGTLLSGDDDLEQFDETLPYGEARFRDGIYLGNPVRIGLLRTKRGERDVFISVAETTLRRDASREKMLTALAWPNFAVLFAALAVLYFGVRRGLSPLANVEEEIAKRSVSDLRKIDTKATPVEIRPMLERLNALFGLLEKSSEMQRRFLADAAHQIKTPLAALQNQVDLAQGEGLFTGNPERIERMQEATERLSHLVNQLLTFARAEASVLRRPEMEEVSLCRIVEESATAFLDAALVKNIDLGFEISSATVLGVSWMLQEALANLIDNAINYTPGGGNITVRCGVEGSVPYLEVEDDGPGIPEVCRTQVFERFFRILVNGEPGCGLGLSIVREIADLHGADILLLDSSSGGTRARLLFSGNRRGQAVN